MKPNFKILLLGLFLITSFASGQKISQMPAATSLDSGDLVPIVQSGINKAAPGSLFIYNPATATDINAGSDNTKYVTANSLGGSIYLTVGSNKMFGIASGTNAYAVSIPNTSNATGNYIFVKFVNANTSSVVTLNVNSLGNVNIVKRNSNLSSLVPLVAKDIVPGVVYLLVYDGSNYQINNLFTVDTHPTDSSINTITSGAVRAYVDSSIGTISTSNYLQKSNNLNDVASTYNSLKNLGVLYNSTVDKSASFTILNSNRGVLYNCSTSTSNIVVTLDASTATDGFVTEIRKSDNGAGYISFVSTPSVTNTIRVSGHTMIISYDASSSKYIVRSIQGSEDANGNITTSTGNNGNINLNPNGTGQLLVNGNSVTTNNIAYDTLTRQYKSYGVEIYNKAYWSSSDLTNDFVTEGTAPTLSTVGGIVYSGGSSNYNNDLLLNYVNYDDNVELEVSFVVNSLTGYSPFVGKRNYQASNGQAMFAGYNYSNNAAILSLAYFDTPSSPRAVTTSGYAVAVNDYCKIKYTKNGSVFYSTFVDVTQGFTCVTSWTNNEADAETLADMAIWNYNSSCEIKQINLWTNTIQKPYIMCIGDSKSKNPSQSQKFPIFLNALGTTEVWAAQSTTCYEQYVYGRPYLCKYFRPKYVVLNIGRNDIALGYDTTQLKTTYTGLVNSLDSIGSTVIHLLIPDQIVGSSQLMLWNFIKRTYPSKYIVDMTAAGWTDALYLASDSTHPNASGARFIAQTIINKGIIPYSNIYNFNPYREDSWSNQNFNTIVNSNRFAKTFQNNIFSSPQLFQASLTSGQTYGMQGFYNYTATANSQTFSALKLNMNSTTVGSFTGVKSYALLTAGANSLFGSTSTAPSVLGEFANISGVPKWFNTSVQRFSMQTDVSGTPNQFGVYNSSGLQVPTTIYNLLGDLNYGGVSAAPTTLTGNTTSTKKFLTQTGTGTVSAAPAWDTIVNADLPTSGVTAGSYSTSTVNTQGITTAAGHLSLTGDVSATESGGAIAVTIGKINGSSVTATTNQGVITTSSSPTSTVFVTQGGSTQNAATASGTNTYTASLTPSISSYTTNLRIWILFANANTGAATLNLNSIGAINIVKYGTNALVGGEIPVGGTMELVYDGTNFQLLNPCLILTTTGTTGASSYTPGTNTLNVPNYAAGSGMGNPMVAAGDMIYGGASGSPTDLSGNITTTPEFLTSTGTGSAATAPAWNKWVPDYYLLYSNTAVSPICSTTSATTMMPTTGVGQFGTGAPIVPANWWQPGRKIRIDFEGQLVTNASGTTLTFGIYLNGNLLQTINSLTVPASSTTSVSGWITMQCISVSSGVGTFYTGGQLLSTSSRVHINQTGATNTFTLSNSMALDIKGTWGASGSTIKINSITIN